MVYRTASECERTWDTLRCDKGGVFGGLKLSHGVVRRSTGCGLFKWHEWFDGATAGFFKCAPFLGMSRGCGEKPVVPMALEFGNGCLRRVETRGFRLSPASGLGCAQVRIERGTHV